MVPVEEKKGWVAIPVVCGGGAEAAHGDAAARPRHATKNRAAALLDVPSRTRLRHVVHTLCRWPRGRRRREQWRRWWRGVGGARHTIECGAKVHIVDEELGIAVPDPRIEQREGAHRPDTAGKTRGRAVVVLPGAEFNRRRLRHISDTRGWDLLADA